jgi:hypothetical protein
MGFKCPLMKITMNSFKLFQLAKKSPFFTHFLSFFHSVAPLFDSKNLQLGKKCLINEFYMQDVVILKKLRHDTDFL